MQTPLGGFVTLTCALASASTSIVPGISATIWVALMLVVLIVVGFSFVAKPVNCTVDAPFVELVRKSEPAIVIFTELFVQLLVHTEAVSGVTDVTVGAGFGAP